MLRPSPNHGTLRLPNDDDDDDDDDHLFISSDPDSVLWNGERKRPNASHRFSSNHRYLHLDRLLLVFGTGKGWNSQVCSRAI